MGETLKFNKWILVAFSLFSKLVCYVGCSISKPKPDSSYMTPVANTNLSDYFHMKIPDGWRSLNRNEYVGMASYRLVRQAENSSSFTGIQVFRIDLNILEERLQMLMVTIGKLTCRNTA